MRQGDGSIVSFSGQSDTSLVRVIEQKGYYKKFKNLNKRDTPKSSNP